MVVVTSVPACNGNVNPEINITTACSVPKIMLRGTHDRAQAGAWCGEHTACDRDSASSCVSQAYSPGDTGGSHLSVLATGDAETWRVSTGSGLHRQIVQLCPACEVGTYAHLARSRTADLISCRPFVAVPHLYQPCSSRRRPCSTRWQVWRVRGRPSRSALRAVRAPKRSLRIRSTTYFRHMRWRRGTRVSPRSCQARLAIVWPSLASTSLDVQFYIVVDVRELV